MLLVEADTIKLYVYHHDATGHTVAVSDDKKEIVNGTVPTSSGLSVKIPLVLPVV